MNSVALLVALVAGYGCKADKATAPADCRSDLFCAVVISPTADLSLVGRNDYGDGSHESTRRYGSLLLDIVGLEQG